jgi:hypothetical protein
MMLSRPRFTVRRMMIGVGCLGLCLWVTFRELPFGGNLGTIYSKGYDETKFRSLRAGMSAREIESIMGSPLKKVPMTGDYELWYYSDQVNALSSYWRRWVYVRHGKAMEVVNVYWVD